MVVHFILLCRLDEAVVMSGDVGCWLGLLGILVGVSSFRMR